MIEMAKFMGRLIMPQSAAVALLTHGTLRLMRLTAAMRRYFDELGNQAEERVPARIVRPGTLGREALPRRPAPARLGSRSRRRRSSERRGAGSVADPGRVRAGPARRSRRGHGARLRRLRRQGRPDRSSRAGASSSPRRLLGGSRRDVPARRRAVRLGGRGSPRPHRSSRRPG